MWIKRILILCVSCIYYMINSKCLDKKHIILTYHNITDANKNRFIKQIKYLRNKFIIVPLDYSSANDICTKYVSITFDDGFSQMARNAIPYLSKYNIPFTIFIPAGYIGKTSSWLSNKKHPTMDVIMSKEEIAYVCKKLNNVTIGSHGYFHKYLTGISKTSLKIELEESKKYLEKITGKEIGYYAAPYGNICIEKVNNAIEAGYKRVYINTPYVDKNIKDKYIYGRINIDPNNWKLEFIMKTHGAYNWYHKYANKIKKISGNDGL